MTSHLPPTILIIDNDLVSRTTASNTLERNGFIVRTKSTPDESLKFLDNCSESSKPHLIIINSALEGLSGIELCTIIKTKKAFSQVPVIMISEKESTMLQLQGLKNSFDDYLIAPFSHNDLISSVKIILGKSKPVLRKKVLSFESLKMDLMSYRVTKNNREVHLGPTEFKILQCFIEEPYRIFSRQDLMDLVWDKKENVELRTVDVHINRLRSALSEPGQHSHPIKTVRSAGYCLELSESVR